MSLKTILIALLMALPALRALAVGHELRIHLRSGETLAVPHAEIRRIQFQNLSSGVDEPGKTVDGFQLLPNAPNPFNPSTVLAYRLETETQVRLAIRDLGGRLVREFVQGRRGPGEHHQVWDGCDTRGVAAASGVYFVVLEAHGHVQTRKLLLVK